MRTLLAVLMAVGVMAVSACQVAGGEGGVGTAARWQLPDRSEPSVVQEEQRLSALLSASDDVLSAPGGDCDVRLLGRDGETSYAWAHCRSGNGEGVSVPVRVDGESVRVPGDGSKYSDDVEALFPARLADEIFNNHNLLP